MLKVRTKKDFLKDFNKHILSGRITESDVTSVVDCLKEQKPLQQK
ncbi:type II toxin-antitoxin system mRNA interferase toxin, RelE/StbE family, partial [Helicobacter pylori]